MTLTIDVARSTPRDADAVGIPVASEGTVSRSLGLTRARLAELGFGVRGEELERSRRSPFLAHEQHRYLR